MKRINLDRATEIVKELKAFEEKLNTLQNFRSTNIFVTNSYNSYLKIDECTAEVLIEDMTDYYDEQIQILEKELETL